MPIRIEELNIGAVTPNDANPAAAIENLTRHVRALWHHIERLEHALAISEGEIKIRSGDAAIFLKKDGTINIEGKNLYVEGSGKINIKAASDLTLNAPNLVRG